MKIETQSPVWFSEMEGRLFSVVKRGSLVGFTSLDSRYDDGDPHLECVPDPLDPV